MALDERHERRLVAAHDRERVIGAPLVLPHEHRADRFRVGIHRNDRRVLAAHGDRDDAVRDVRMRARQLAHCVDERDPQADRVLFGGARAPVDRQRACRVPDDGAGLVDQHDFAVRRPDVDADRARHGRILTPSDFTRHLRQTPGQRAW